MAAPAIATATKRGWLNDQSPLHDEMDWLWEQNERRFEGGHNVHPELWRFDWETVPYPTTAVFRDGVSIPVRNTEWSGNTANVTNKDNFNNAGILAPGEHYQRRQRSAIYVNLMEAYATDVSGQLFKHAPAPSVGLDFGALGEVRRIQDIDTPTLAELIYYNTDGIGSDGSQWDSFWSMQLKLAMATGVRWIFTEAPRDRAVFRRREALGFRPYLIGFSPRQLWNHHYDRGQLQWAIIKVASRRPKIVNDAFEANDRRYDSLLLVRAGNTDLGNEFSDGGWWRFDPDGVQIPNETGTWDRTDGEIPMAPLVYDRHDRLIGRPGLTELGNASIALMNIQSAADFDAFDSAGSVIAVRGVDAEGFNLFIQKVREGNRYAPLPTNEETQDTPDLRSATEGVTAADVFEKRITAILRSADRIRGMESAAAPQASGLAQQAGFTLSNVPRLALVAGNIETCMNSSIKFLEQRGTTKKPSGSARWTRKFELITLTSSAQAILQLEAIAGIHSEELEATVIVAAAQDEGFVPDNAKRTLIENELRASRRKADKQAEELAAAKAQPPQVPGARSRNMPPEPAQTNQPVKSQLDGPNVE